MRRIKKEFAVFVYVILAAFLLWCVLVFVLRTDTPVVIISSGSMEPALNAGDIVFVQGVNASALEIGDIIVYKCPSKEELCVRENQLVAHRVEKINKEYGMKTKGDANERQDSCLVRFSWVKGKMLFKIPFFGKPIVLLKQVMSIS